jgi:ATPase subunit of ABC transporter with duplicated ATPase domains
MLSNTEIYSVNERQNDFGVAITRAFPFDAKKQYDFVDRLSGGIETFVLCTVLIQNPNFLILDEPTNDLDIVT